MGGKYSCAIFSLVLAILHSFTWLLRSDLGVPRRLIFDSAGVETTRIGKNIRYYVYEEEAISQKGRMQEAILQLSHQRDPPPDKYRIMRDLLSEMSVYDSLRSHPLRTMDPNEADFFIVSTPIASLLYYGCSLTMGRNCSDFDDAFDALTSHPLFINDANGTHHVIVNLHWLPFSRKWSNKVPFIARNYPKLKNVILANRFDPLQVDQIVTRSLATGHDYEKLFRKNNPPITRSGFSMAYGLEKDLPLFQATMAKFDNNKFFIFYRTRKRPFGNGSTQYRHHAPLNLMGELANSSIGHDLPKDEWHKQFASSQFCLVIRGDSPESHAFAHAIRVGCIPVVISDWYHDWAGPFKSTLNMNDFCIMIKESDFIASPLLALQGLKEIKRSVLELKMKALKYAQRVIFPDHPQSLFVPAFLKEASAALELSSKSGHWNQTASL